MDDVIFLYDQAIEHIVRLHGFRSSKRRDLGEGGDVQDDVDSVADLLAKRDLLTFSGSLRNFAEAAKAVQDMRQLRVSTCKLIAPPQPPYFVESGETLSLYQVLSQIIHSHTLSILRSSYDFCLLAAKTEEDLFSIPSQPIIESETILLVQTEQDPATAVGLRALIHVACSFLGPVSERLHIIAELPRRWPATDSVRIGSTRHLASAAATAQPRGGRSARPGRLSARVALAGQPLPLHGIGGTVVPTHSYPPAGSP